ncbi:MAG TPA: chromate transporter, partial [Pseudomonas sp.]|nr:chromate transporter [Pseudomonas sp.]
NPVLSSAVHTWHDVVYAGLAYLSLQWLRVPAWLLVLLAIILGWWLGS